MEKQSLSKFITMQFALMLLIVIGIPEFGMPSITPGAVLNDTITFLLTIVGVVLYVMNLLYFNKKASAAGSKLDLKFMICSAVGALLVFYANLPEIQGSLQAMAEDMMSDAIFSVIGFGLLTYSFIISAKSLGVEFANIAAKGAYLILMCMLVRTYNCFDDAWLVGIAAFAALFVYWKSLTKISTGTDAAIVEGVSKLKISIILSIIAIVFGFIPLFGWIIAGILMVVAFVMELLAYGKFAGSSSLSEVGQKGAKKLKTSMILCIVGAVIGLIPFTGVVETILNIIAFVFIFLGWKGVMLGFQEKAEA